ncbi:MAG: hypothetical protein EOS18_28955 [Mesorhizobium sp.]|nr:MAG: hypothetical protein EOS18_28955 [Mesorhizobium sp.]
MSRIRMIAGIAMTASALSTCAMTFSSLAQSAPKIDLCADFTIFPDNAPFSSEFVLSSFKFKSKTSNLPWFANLSGGSVGLQFNDDGFLVTLPTLTSEVRMRVGTYNRPINVEAVDSAGKSLNSTKIEKQGLFDLNLAGEGIAAISVVGGGHEGIISTLCMWVPIQ